jgi:hypothetical protein
MGAFRGLSLIIFISFINLQGCGYLRPVNRGDYCEYAPAPILLTEEDELLIDQDIVDYLHETTETWVRLCGS